MLTFRKISQTIDGYFSNSGWRRILKCHGNVGIVERF
jgi:hypothetical protein